MTPYGEGEYLNERETPLSDWFKGSNLQKKISVEIAGDGDLFGNKANAMLAIRHLRQRRVIHVPLAEAVAQGLPQMFIPRELRHREAHAHRCYDCHEMFTCADLSCYGGDVADYCPPCMARANVDRAEVLLRQEQERTPNLWESPDNITRRIFKLKSAVARAQRKLEELTVYEQTKKTA